MRMIKEISPSSAGLFLRRAFFILSAILLPHFLWTQEDTDGAEEDEIEELEAFEISGEEFRGWNSQRTFSGTRSASNLLDIPVNIAIINEDYLEDIGSENLMEAIAYSASGVTQRVNYRDDITIRGFRTGPVRDGVPYSSLAFTPLWDVQQLEVIKGPQAILTANISNIQGVVNYVTKRPTPEFEGEVTAALGGFDGLDTYIAHGTVSGPLKGVAGDNIGYRITAGFQQSDGWRNGNDRTDYESLSSSFDWYLTDDNRLKLELDFEFTNNSAGGFNRGLIDPATGELVSPEVLDPEFSTHAPWSFKDTMWYRVRPTLIWNPAKNLSLRTLYQRHEYEYNYNIAQPVPGLDAAETSVGPALTVGQRWLRFDRKWEEEWIQSDLVWQFSTGPVNNRFMAGFEWGKSDNNDDLFLGSLPDIIVNEPFGDRPPPPAREDWTVLFEDNGGPGENWSFYLGNNFSFWEDRLILSVSARNSPDAAGENGDEDVWTERYGVVYKITPEFSIYAQEGESFNNLTGTDFLGNELKPVTGESTEIGMKFNALDGRVFGTASYFDILVDPVLTQISVVDPGTGEILYGNSQVGKQTNEGFEFDGGIIYPVGDGELSVYGTLYFGDPLTPESVDSDTGETIPARQASRAVKEKRTLFVKYTFLEGQMGGFYAGAGWSHTGSSPGVGFPIQPAFDIFTAVFGYNAENWSLQLNIDNLEDNKRAFVGSEASFSVDVYRPRYARVSYTYRF